MAQTRFKWYTGSCVQKCSKSYVVPVKKNTLPGEMCYAQIETFHVQFNC